MTKPLFFMGSSHKDLLEFPKEVRQQAGFALYLAQMGGMALYAVPLVGFGGAHVLEVVISEDGNAYRAVYTVKFDEAVYMLHAFQKKSKKGSETPKPDVQLIRKRLKAAQNHYEKNFGALKRKDVSA